MLKLRIVESIDFLLSSAPLIIFLLSFSCDIVLISFHFAHVEFGEFVHGSLNLFPPLVGTSLSVAVELPFGLLVGRKLDNELFLSSGTMFNGGYWVANFRLWEVSWRAKGQLYILGKSTGI